MWRITLAEAVAKAGGLIDVQADPASVYLYRREPRELAQRLGVDASRFDGPTVPVIYNISLRDPAGYFLATKIQMRNKDVIFAANAESVEVTKFMQLLQVVINTGVDATAGAENAQYVRILSHSHLAK
jgi:polysaccharide export outer membrane protein